MILLACAVLLIAVTVAFTFFVRTQDIPQVPPVSPVRHLEERRASIYENLRDLQFEYRVGKLSDADYQQSKVGLQKELAEASLRMDFSEPDAAPEDVLNRAIWHSVKGYGTRYPMVGK